MQELSGNPSSAAAALAGECTCSTDSFRVNGEHAASCDADYIPIRGFRYLRRFHVQLLSRCLAAGEHGLLPQRAGTQTEAHSSHYDSESTLHNLALLKGGPKYTPTSGAWLMR